MSESTCPVCAARCRRLRAEYLTAKANGAKKTAKKAASQAKKSGCRWARKGSRP